MGETKLKEQGSLYNFFEAHAKSLSEMLNFCIQCGECSASCPSSSMMNFTLRQAVTAIGASRIGTFLNEKIIDNLMDQVKEGAWYCFDCGLCEEICPEDMKIPELMQTVRGNAKVTESIPRPAQFMQKNIKTHHNPYGSRPQQKRTAWSEEYDLPQESETMLFMGCTPSYREKEILRSTIEILPKELEVGILEEEWCCGYPAEVMGHHETAQELAENNIEKLEKAGAEQVICVCPSCYRTLKEEYPKILGRDLPFEILHITEYLSQNREKIEDKLDPVKKRITYQDSCHLGRHMGVYESPRDVLKIIPELELVEMRRNRWWARCCGGGGGVKSINPDFSHEKAMEIVKEANRKQVSEIITACPFCKSNIGETIEDSDLDMNIEYITEFLREALTYQEGEK